MIVCFTKKLHLLEDIQVKLERMWSITYHSWFLIESTFPPIICVHYVGIFHSTRDWYRNWYKGLKGLLGRESEVDAKTGSKSELIVVVPILNMNGAYRVGSFGDWRHIVLLTFDFVFSKKIHLLWKVVRYTSNYFLSLSLLISHGMEVFRIYCVLCCFNTFKSIWNCFI